MANRFATKKEFERRLRENVAKSSKEQNLSAEDEEKVYVAACASLRISPNKEDD